MKTLKRMTAVAAVIMPLLTQSQIAEAGVPSSCWNFLRDYFVVPIVKGGSEEIGKILVNYFYQGQAEGKIPADQAPPSAMELAPGGQIDDGYIAYLQSLGFTECQIRQAVYDVLGPPPSQVLN